MHRMNLTDPLHDSAAELIKAAQSFNSAASQPGTHGAAPFSLARTEEALQLLSGAWYQLAADASPRIARRSRLLSARDAESSGTEGLSREQEARLTAALHDVAAAFARCARSCREGRSAVTPVIAGCAEDEEIEHERSPGESVPFGKHEPQKQRVA
jgi:hypothetical protein